VNCFKCLKTLESAFGNFAEDYEDDSKAPNRGLLFAAHGNYGSRIWDPTMSAPDLVVWICDDCIVAHKELVQLRNYAHVKTEILWADFDPEKAYW
jgi:hypothetical protein